MAIIEATAGSRVQGVEGSVTVAGVLVPTRKVNGVEYVGLHQFVQAMGGRYWRVENRFIVVLPGDSLECVFTNDTALVLRGDRWRQVPITPLVEAEQLFLPAATLTSLFPQPTRPVLRAVTITQRGDTLALLLETDLSGGQGGESSKVQVLEQRRSALEYRLTLAASCDSVFGAQLALFSLTSGNKLVQRISLDTSLGTTLELSFRQPASQRVSATAKGIELRVWPSPQRRVTRIVLDPGHGGPDPGALGRRGTQEKTVVLDIARRLAKLLRAKGFEVILTHDTDQYQSLADRSKLASEVKADLFISIHANWAENRLANGFESYFLSEAKSNWERAVAARENAALEFDLPETGQKEVLELILTDLAQNEFLWESSELAARIQEAVVKRARVKDRGVRQANFYVLRNNFMPAVLLECGYLSNRSEEKLLRKSEHREQLAQGISAGVVAFVREYERRINGNNHSMTNDQ